MSIESFKNKLFIASFGLGLVSTVGAIQPDQNLKQLGFLGLGATIASVAVSELITGKCHTSINENSRILETQLKGRNEELKTQNQKLSEVTAELKTLKLYQEKLTSELQQLSQSIKEKNTQLVLAKDEITRLGNNLRDVGKFSTSEAHGIVKKTYNRSLKKLENQIDALIRNYPQCQEKLNSVLIDVDALRSRFTKKVEEYEGLETFEELLDIGLQIQELIIDKCIELRVKAQTIVIKYLGEIVQDSIPFTDFETHIASLTNKAAEQLQEVQTDREKNIQAIAQEWVVANQNHVDRYEVEFTDVLNTAKTAVNRIQELESLSEKLQNRINELEHPILWRIEVTEAARIGNKIIKFFAAKGIRLDRSHIDNDPYEPVVYFHANRLNDVVVADDLNKFSDYLQQHCEVIEPPHFTYNGETGLFQSKIKLSIKPKASKEELVAKIPSCKSLVEKSKRGFLITGHPGAGKTSSIKAISQWLGDNNTMRLALNPHSDDMSSFTDSGFIEVNDLDEIYEAIALLDEELKIRGQVDKSRRGLLIIAIDELGRILRDAPKNLKVMEILRQAAVEGRKLNIIILIGNHSQTTEAIDMDGQFRESFYQIFLVGAARYKINMPNAPAVSKSEGEWIQSAAYPVLVGVDGRYKACQHPTHHAYSDFQDSGNLPIGLEPTGTNTVILGSKTYLAIVETEGLSTHQKELIAQNKDLVNLSSNVGLSKLIETVFNVKASKSKEYKELRNQVLEHLKTIA